MRDRFDRFKVLDLAPKDRALRLSPAGILQKNMKKVVVVIIAFALIGNTMAEGWTPRLNIDQKKLIDEALAHLLKHDPQLKAEDLEVTALSYQYQPMEGQALACGPQGCVWVPAAPFSESLAVTFRNKGSERRIGTGGQETILSEGIAVEFPSPRRPEWSFGKVSYAQPVAPKAKSADEPKSSP